MCDRSASSSGSLGSGVMLLFNRNVSHNDYHLVPVFSKNKKKHSAHVTKEYPRKSTLTQTGTDNENHMYSDVIQFTVLKWSTNELQVTSISDMFCS